MSIQQMMIGVGSAASPIEERISQRAEAINTVAGGPVTLLWPATPIVGNLLVIGVTAAAGGTNVTAPAGWNRTNGTTGTAIFWKFAEAGEPSSVNFSISAGRSQAFGAEFSGIVGPDAAAPSNGTGASVSTGAMPVLAVANSLIVALYTQTGSGTFTALGQGQTEINQIAAGTVNFGMMAFKIVDVTTQVNYTCTGIALQTWRTYVQGFSGN
jgi:hypothetical protein